MSERLETAKQEWAGQGGNEPDDEQPALLARATRTVDSLFGSHIPLLPLTTSAAPPAGTDAQVGQDDIQDWLFTASAVRTGARDLQHVRVLADGLASALPPLRAWQWPPNLAGWIGDGLAAADARAGDLTSVVVQPATPLAAGAPFAALVADEWQDVIPSEKETTGIAFHYDAPNAEPPQALLLAVSAAALERNMRWTWDELVASVEQALDLAKMRAVEPDQLRATRLDAVLPATIMAEAALPVTISTSLLANVSEKIAEGQLHMWSSIKA
jgi:hypothetical protein